MQLEDGDVQRCPQWIACSEGEAISLFRQGEWSQLNRQFRVVLQVITDCGSIEDHRFRPVPQHVVNRCCEGLRWNDSHVLFLRQLLSARALQYCSPLASQLGWIRDAVVCVAREKQGEGGRQARS